MYRITCDGFPMLDLRDNDLMVTDPKVNLEVNTVGEGSFTIYKNHPHFDKLTPMRSLFEVSDDAGVIFRGRATGNTVAFDHGKHVDLEGAMAFFNDSVVRPFNFPDDFQEDADYLSAEASGDRLAFFLGWLIGNHNAQVQEFQRLKLGNVTVRDAAFARSSDEYASTWEMLKAKLFESTLGGYLCIRYEADGNYIDYLSEFTEVNRQEIAFGENLLDLRNETEASEIYTAIIPVGALGLTLSGLDDRDITTDIVKSGDTLYSKKLIAEYGWIYAPVSETTWEDVVDDADLLKVGVNWLMKGGSMLNVIEATAVDLHFTDEQAESLRIYKNVNVHSAPHGLAESVPLKRLELDLLNPQNTKIIVGKTIETFTEQAAFLQEEAKKKYSKLSKTAEQIRLEVVDEINGLSSSFTQEMDSFRLAVEGIVGTDADGNLLSVSSSISAALKGIALSVSSSAGSTTFTLTADGAQLSTKSFDLTVDAVNVSGKLTASQIDATELKVSAANISGTLTASQIALSGSISWSDLDDTMQTYLKGHELPSYITSTYIDSVSICSPTIHGGTFIGNKFNVMAATEEPGGFNLYGKHGIENVHALSIGYAAGLAPTVTFATMCDGNAIWNFPLTVFGGGISLGANDINFNVGEMLVSLRDMESRISALESK